MSEIIKDCLSRPGVTLVLDTEKPDKIGYRVIGGATAWLSRKDIQRVIREAESQLQLYTELLERLDGDRLTAVEALAAIRELMGSRPNWPDDEEVT